MASRVTTENVGTVRNKKREIKHPLPLKKKKKNNPETVSSSRRVGYAHIDDNARVIYGHESLLLLQNGRARDKSARDHDAQVRLGATPVDIDRGFVCKFESSSITISDARIRSVCV